MSYCEYLAARLEALADALSGEADSFEDFMYTPESDIMHAQYRGEQHTLHEVSSRIRSLAREVRRASREDAIRMLKSLEDELESMRQESFEEYMRLKKAYGNDYIEQYYILGNSNAYRKAWFKIPRR